jgi:uncharacterized caspase-like protein
MYSKLKDEKGRGFKKVKVYPLLKKEETTANNIKESIIDLSRMGIKDNDLVVVFISSHGKVNDQNEFILMPSDYDSRYEEVRSVNFNKDILERLEDVNGNKLLFVDACQSGSAGGKSFSDQSASIAMNSLIRSASGMEIFASCGDKEFSYEDQSWGNGAFTKAIIEAFQNRAVRINGRTIQADVYAENPITGAIENGSDGVITIEELKLFVQKRVPYMVKMTKDKSQNPTNKSEDKLPGYTAVYMVNK